MPRRVTHMSSTPANAMTPLTSAIVLHLPHGSVVIPDDLRRTFLPDDAGLQRELVAMTDHHTVDLFGGVECADAVVFPVSRLVVDPERFLDDAQEPMARCGMGVLYTTCSTGEPLRHAPNAAAREALLARFYHPHHARLTAAVDDAIMTHDCALIVDCHSFPAAPRAQELHHVDVRPDICLGTDAFHTPPWLTDAACAVFASEGYRVTVDAPYAGTIVPLSHYHRDRRVMSLMIEVNRGLYVDEDTGERLPDFGRHRAAIARAVHCITDRAAHHMNQERA